MNATEVNTVYGHASMIALGTLNIPQASFHREGPSAWDSARKASSRTSLAVMIFAFPEGQLKDNLTILGAFEEGRELSRTEASELLRNGYVPPAESNDPVAYARERTQSPATHALLDEVERGRARRRGQGAPEEPRDEP
jgi:hypothetical protein